MNKEFGLAQIFSDGMLLQREKKVAIWGSARPQAQVRVSVQGMTAETSADDNGAWMLWLDPLAASMRETLVAESGEERIVVEDVAVGEVWIAGGQSNMEFPMRFEKYRDEELDTVQPMLRFYDVPEIFYEGQDQDFDYSNVGFWRRAEGDSLTYFSAVGYYFQKELAGELDVPVGIVGCNWGGTCSCAWMKPETAERVGAPWLEWWVNALEGQPEEEYWASKRGNPLSNAGNPNTDPFSCFIMPDTPDGQAVETFFREVMGVTPEMMVQMPAGPEPKHKPGILYQHMVQKIAPYTVRGCIWYQGESDDQPGLQALYADMLEGMIGDWRALWGEELPFMIVQLPGWRSWLQLINMDYATIRHCQEEVAKRVPAVYMASISDVGEEKDIHPKDKRTVGHRLALLARHYLYGQELLCEAPRPECVTRQGNQIRIRFRYAGDRLTLQGEQVEALQVKAGDRELPYQASVQGYELVIDLEQAMEGTVEISLAQGDWYRVNLYNSAGISAIPFFCEAPHCFG